MLAGPTWLALEVKYLDPAVDFYRDHLGLSPNRTGEAEVTFDVGDTDLVLRAPSTVPRGGLHTHYAFSTDRRSYDAWWERLDGSFDLVEHRFGNARSLYFYDTEGNCVEIGERNLDHHSTDHGATEHGATDEDASDQDATDGDASTSTEPTLTGVFEVVLEVEHLDRAVTFYADLGFDVMDRGGNRQRVRLTCGAFDIELWEPHLGLAEARGGVHVDLGIACDEPSSVVDRVRGQALATERCDTGWQLRDPDGHYVTLV